MCSPSVCSFSRSRAKSPMRLSISPAEFFDTWPNNSLRFSVGIWSSSFSCGHRTPPPCQSDWRSTLFSDQAHTQQSSSPVFLTGGAGERFANDWSPTWSPTLWHRQHQCGISARDFLHFAYWRPSGPMPLTADLAELAIEMWLMGHYVPVPSDTGWTDGDLEDRYITSR